MFSSFLHMFFFFFFFPSDINSSWSLTESCIDKNWKLEDWIDKTES